jgi:hypothetical protein
MPGHFIGEVEHSPVIADLTQFVLRRALKELGAMDLPDGFRLTVNLAAFHAGLRGFPGDLTDILSASHTRLQLALEITERGLLAGIDGVKDSLARLSARVSNSPLTTSARKTAILPCCSGFSSTTSRSTGNSSRALPATIARCSKVLFSSRGRSARRLSARASKNAPSRMCWTRSACPLRRASCLRGRSAPENSHKATRRPPGVPLHVYSIGKVCWRRWVHSSRVNSCIVHSRRVDVFRWNAAPVNSRTHVYANREPTPPMLTYASLISGEEDKSSGQPQPDRVLLRPRRAHFPGYRHVIEVDTK